MKNIDDLIELIMGDPKIRENKTLVNSFRVRFAKPFLSAIVSAISIISSLFMIYFFLLFG